jgi:hypothetical protein
MVMTMKITVFWDMTSCSVIKFIRLNGIMPETIVMLVHTFFKSLFLGQNVTGLLVIVEEPLPINPAETLLFLFLLLVMSSQL